jgi:polyhydroxyalkanoate synthesis regulator phasin
MQEIPNDGSKTRSRYHHGLIAQEVKQVMDSNSVDFGGYQDHTVKGGQEQLSIAYTELIGPMIKAIQELKTEVDTLKQRITTIENK